MQQWEWLKIHTTEMMLLSSKAFTDLQFANMFRVQV